MRARSGSMTALLLALAASALGALAPGAATAAGPQDGSPTALMSTSHQFPHGYMEYSAAAGQTVQDSVSVKNPGPGPATFDVFAADGLTSQVTGVVYADMQHPFPDGPAGNGEYGAGTWISLSASSLQLAEGETAIVNFTVKVPAAAAPGDHVGSISAENPTPARGSGQFGFNVTTRTTIAVVVHVAGPVKTEGVTVGTPYITVENRTRQILNIPLEYFGDVLVKPYVNLRVVDARGRVLLHIDRQLDTFVPHTTLIFPVPLDTLVLDPGNYTLVIDFGPQGFEQHFQLPFRVTVPQAAVPQPSQRGRAAHGLSPLLWLLALIPLFALLLLLAVLRRRRRECAHCGRRWSGPRVAVAQVPDVASCIRCRDDLERRGSAVRLCPDCLAGHRGWRKAAAVAGAASSALR